MKKIYIILAFILLSLIVGQKSYGQNHGVDFDAGETIKNFSATINLNPDPDKQRDILQAIAQVNPVGLVNLQTGDPTANVNINFAVSTTTGTSANSSSTSTTSANWGVSFLSLASVSAASSCWICDLINPDPDSNNVPSTGSNNLPDSAITTTDSSSLSYFWNNSNNNLAIIYAIYLDPLFDTQEYEDKLYSKVRADIDMINHSYDNYAVTITPSGGVELWYLESHQYETGPWATIDSEGNVKITTWNGYKSPSQLNSNDVGERRRLALVASYLGKDIGIRNKGITIVSERGDELSSKNPAWTRDPPGTEINLNRNGGFSESLDKVNSFKSILKHEIFHVDDKIKGVGNGYVTHVDVYLKQMEHDTFKNTTLDYKLSTGHVFAKYLLNIDQKDFRETTSHHALILSKIQTFNSINQGVMFIRTNSDTFAAGYLTLYITLQGYQEQNVTYDYYKI